MMLMTPFMALAPHSVAPGPRDDLDAIDVIHEHVLHVVGDAGKQRRIDAAPVDEHEDLVGEVLHIGAPANPRAPFEYLVDESCVTCRLGARRSASGMLVTPERRISSRVIT